MLIRVDDLGGPEIALLLEDHLRDMRTTSPPESKHALDLESLCKPDITFWTIWDGTQLTGCGALKALDTQHGEIKSMRTVTARQRQGVASSLLRHIIAEARQRDYRRLSLETGSMPFFAPARQLYTNFGFAPCAPFATYKDDPNSVFMTLEF